MHEQPARRRKSSVTSKAERVRGVAVVPLLLAFAVIARAGISDEQIHQINQDVRMVLQRTETPGASILAIRDGRVIYRKAFGLRDLERRLSARMVVLRTVVIFGTVDPNKNKSSTKLTWAIIFHFM